MPGIFRLDNGGAMIKTSKKPPEERAGMGEGRNIVFG